MRDNDEAYVYIMASESGTLYVGSTIDLGSRVYQHKKHVLGGLTTKYRCHKLVYFEILEDLGAARQREYQLKKFRREKKERLIRSQSPAWFDLSDRWEKT